KITEKVLHGGGKRADEARNTFGGLDERLPGRVGYDAGEIVAFAHERREAGPHQRGRCLIYKRDQSTPKELQFHRIKVTSSRPVHAGPFQVGSSARIEPSGKSLAVLPGPITKVLSFSSNTAGPAILVPVDNA